MEEGSCVFTALVSREDRALKWIIIVFCSNHVSNTDTVLSGIKSIIINKILTVFLSKNMLDVLMA